MGRLAVAMVTIALSFSVATAQERPINAPTRSEMVERFYRGRAIINEAVQAAGGAQALRGINAIAYVAAGELSNDVQGYAAANIGSPARDGDVRYVNRLDFAGGRFYQELQQHFDSGYDAAFATIWRGGTQYFSRSIPSDYTETANAPSPFAAGGAVMVSSRWLPPVILQRALQNFRSVAWVGEGATADGAADIVELSFDEATRFRVYVSRASHLIQRVEAVAPDPIVADDLSVAEMSGQQTVAGIVFPAHVRALRRGAPTQTLALTGITINPSFSAADFSPPEGFARIDASTQVRATQIAGRVYEVSGLAGGTYQVPFVVMDDFVVAYEAPLGIAQTRQVIAEIRRIAGDKPIRYVVISHFHSDHAGGVGAYVDAGATVLASAGNQLALQAYAAGNRPQYQGLEGPRSDVVMQFQAIPEGGYDIVDRAGSHLRVIDFAGTSHVDHMLALFDPETGVLMGADHYIEAVLWNPTFERTANWVQRNRGVAIILGVHTQPASRDDFLASAQRRRGEPRRGRITWEGRGR